MKSERHSEEGLGSQPTARTFFLGLLLAAVTFAVYAQVRGHEFVTFDDPSYITGNSHITRGLSWGGVTWWFDHVHGGNWHPLTSVSHMIDCDMFGVWAGGHHLMSAAIHALNGALLFVALRFLTGSVWRSYLVAALFALHPLRVESVAWASERKDVLAGLFWMLTLIAYAWYVKRPGRVRYSIVAGCLVLGLMSKPMVVTLPFVLLLLDVWPLRRFGRETGISWSGLALEKLPLIGLSAAAAAVTVLVQRSVGALSSIDRIPLTVRIENGLISYVAYLQKTFWPASPAVFYPHPAYVRSDAMSTMIAAAVVAVIVLAGVTFLVLRFGRSRPYLGVGWLWYLATLVPVIGIIQVGDQSMADRYTYLPQIGILFAIVWGMSELAERRHSARLLVGLAASSVVVGLTVATWIQIGPWSTSEALYTQALRATSNNYRVNALLGQVYLEKGDLDAAEAQFRRVLSIKPNSPDGYAFLGEVAARRGDSTTAEIRFRKALEIEKDDVNANNNLGVLYARTARYDEAVAHLERVVAIDPDDLEARVNLGLALLNQHRPELAATHLVRAIELQPDDATAQAYLGMAYGMGGNVRLAESHLRRSLELAPDDARVQANLGSVLAGAGRLQEAEGLYRSALRHEPDLVEASIPLAWILSTARDPSLRNGEEAVRLAERNVVLAGHANADVLDRLAEAYAEAGRFADAVTTASRALELSTESGSPEQRAAIEARLQGYRSGLPFRSP
jgi:tetratricopeptide (TPR) repeat protein